MCLNVLYPFITPLHQNGDMNLFNGKIISRCIKKCFKVLIVYIFDDVINVDLAKVQHQLAWFKAKFSHIGLNGP